MKSDFLIYGDKETILSKSQLFNIYDRIDGMLTSQGLEPLINWGSIASIRISGKLFHFEKVGDRVALVCRSQGSLVAGPIYFEDIRYSDCSPMDDGLMGFSPVSEPSHMFKPYIAVIVTGEIIHLKQRISRNAHYDETTVRFIARTIVSLLNGKRDVHKLASTLFAISASDPRLDSALCWLNDRLADINVIAEVDTVYSVEGTSVMTSKIDWKESYRNVTRNNQVLTDREYLRMESETNELVEELGKVRRLAESRKNYTELEQHALELSCYNDQLVAQRDHLLSQIQRDQLIHEAEIRELRITAIEVTSENERLRDDLERARSRSVGGGRRPILGERSSMPRERFS